MITKPTFLIDELKCRSNINYMAEKAASNNLIFRPHFKTHQSLEIGSWFKEVGVSKITVSSIEMASYFSAEWDDITIAFPLNVLEMDAINQLAEKITVNLTIENIASITFLSAHIESSVNIFIKIDVGLHRTGINPANLELINAVLNIIDSNPYINFVGFLGHAGHTYLCKSAEEVKNVHADSLKIMSSLREKYSRKFPNLLVSLGDTPSCSIADDFSGMDEMRPGNFVFYDLMQVKIGSSSVSKIAVALACPIVAIHKDRLEIVIYGGGVHFSKDSLEDNNKIIYGRVVKNNGSTWGDIIPNMYVKSLSQEHGIVKVPKSQITNFKIGDVLIVLPIHSCMTANLMKSYHNKNKLITMM